MDWWHYVIQIFTYTIVWLLATYVASKNFRAEIKYLNIRINGMRAHEYERAQICWQRDLDLLNRVKELEKRIK